MLQAVSTTVKLSISLPSDLLDRAEQTLARPGEGRRHLFARVLREALQAAEEAAIDAEYERAYGDPPFSEDEQRLRDALTRASLQGLANRVAPERG